MPVYSDETEEFEDDVPFEGIGLIAKIKNLLSEGNNSNILTTGLIGLILFCGIKLFKKEEPETVIGLSQSLRDREISLYKDMSMKGLTNSIAYEQPTVPQVAPKEPIVPQVKPNFNANAGYGLRAYQSSSRNPYMSADNTMMQKTQQVKPQPRVMSTVGSRVNTLNINRPVQPNMTNTVAKASNIDSMKFLDSMAKIYEKNGRSDLAQGLKAGMLKAKADY